MLITDLLNDYNREHLYEILQRIGYYLPDIKSQWLTKKVMLQMQEGHTYCPKYADLILRPCPQRPLKAELIHEVNGQIARSDGISMCLDIADKRSPDVGWLLAVLSTLNKEHRYFQMDWSPDPEPNTDLLERYDWMQKHDALPEILRGIPIKLAV